jgi:hypothetical protein
MEDKDGSWKVAPSIHIYERASMRRRVQTLHIGLHALRQARRRLANHMYVALNQRVVEYLP